MTQNRIENRFAKVRAENRAALVTFVTAGDPNYQTASQILHGLPAAGADIIELGMPFSDPMADGPAIQLANLRALAAGITLKKTIQMVEEFRQSDNDTPIVLMGYYNPIHYYGVQAFIEKAVEVGIDGLIIVDLPPEEDNEMCHPCLTAGLNWIRLTTPTSDDHRLETVLRKSSGFVYYVSIAGITGTQSAEAHSVKDSVDRIKRHTDLPVAVGFGIKTAESVADIAAIADGVVVGSAIVDRIRLGTENNMSADEISSEVHQFVAELALGTPKSQDNAE